MERAAKFHRDHPFRDEVGKDMMFELNVEECVRHPHMERKKHILSTESEIYEVRMGDIRKGPGKTTQFQEQF